uniref:oleoyl-[acyl-carrier-protein] hydrolase n=2 Tax=Steinernema glaseri TaxID=37863 RepID=A0A1I7YYK3_9BILA
MQEHRRLHAGDNLLQLIKSSRGLYEHETLFIALGDVRHDAENGRLQANALPLRKCDIRCPPAAGAENVSRFLVDSWQSVPEDGDEFYVRLVNKFFTEKGLELNAKEIRFPVGYVPVHMGTISRNEDQTVDVFIHTEDGFPAVQLLGIDQDPTITTICDVLKDLQFQTSMDRTFQFMGMDSLHIANFEFALKRRFPIVDLPFGTCLRVNTVPKLAEFLKKSRKAKQETEALRIPKFDWHKQKRCPMSASQRRFSFLHHMNPDEAEQLVESFSVPLVALARNDLGESVNRVFRRHSVLRTIYARDEQFVCSLTESFYYLCESCTYTADEHISDLSFIPVRMRISGKYIDVSMHHIMTDGMSTSLLAKELLCPSSDTCLQYADYAAYENSQDFSEGLTFWRSRLSNTEVPKLDEISTKEDNRSCSNLFFSLEGLCHSSQTPFTVLISLYKMVVYKLYGCEDYPIGIAVANRRHPELMNVQGCFINTIVLRKAIKPNESLERNTSLVGKELQACLQFQDVPFDLVVSELNMDRTDDSPLFDVLFILDDFEDGIPVKQKEKKISLYKQIWYLKKVEGSWQVKVEYQNQVYNERKIQKQVEIMRKLTRNISSVMHQKISDISLGDEEPNCQECDFPLTHPLRIIAKQMELKGDSLLQDYREQKLLYQVFENSKRLACTIQQDLITKTGEVSWSDYPVALYLVRNLKLVEIVIAIWHLGATVVPISRDWPEERVAEILDGLNCFIVTDSPCLRRTKGLNISRQEGNSTKVAYARNSVADLLYMTYTSGSTGRPKAVCTEARGLPNLIMNYNQSFMFTHTKRLYQVVNYSFDIFFADILQVLLNGSSCRLAESKIPDPFEMEGLTHAYVMPAYLSSIEPQHYSVLKGLETIQFGGEPIQENFRQKAISEGINLYQQFGITEHTVYSHVKRVKILDARNDIGMPFSNYRFKITDKDSQLTPNGFKGYFNTGGVGLFRGYFGGHRLSSPWFNTGDLMNYEKGRLLLHGREDFQVKILGHRIELGEIEAVLSKLDEVDFCCVAARPDLTAYIVPAVTQPEDSLRKQITQRLEELLPHYMIPQQLIFLRKFPLNSNGKIDRGKLFELSNGEDSMKANEHKTCNTSMEKTIKGVLKKYLKVNDIAVDQSIFEAGANSLHLLLALQELKDKHGVIVELRDAFKAKTIEKIAALAITIKAEMDGRKMQKVLTFPILADLNQQAQWFLSRQSGVRSEQYLLTFRIHYDIGFNMKRFIQAVNTVVSTHRALRTIVFAKDSDIYQASLSRTESYLLLLPSVDDFTIDISSEVPVKLKIAENPAQITVVFHHIAVDGVSLGIIAESLSEAYNTGLPLPAVIQPQPEYSVEQEGLKYWISELSEIKDPVKLPYDIKNPLSTDCNAKYWTTTLEDISQEFIKRRNCSSFSVLIAAYAILLRKLTGSTTVTVGVPFANRSPENQGMIGNFVNTVCLKIRTSFEKFEDYMDHVNDVVFNAHKHQNVRFEKIVQELNPDRVASGNPLFSTMFVLNNASMKVFPKMRNCNFEAMEIQYTSAKFDMTWFVEDSELKVEYNADIFKEESVEKFVKNFKVILSRIQKEPMDLMDLIRDRKPKMFLENRKDYPWDSTMGKILQKQAYLSKNEALLKTLWNGQTISYREAYGYARTVARAIAKRVIENCGEEVLADDVIAICYPEGMENHIGIMVALVLGCAYVPMDPANPLERNKQILNDSGATALLTDSTDYGDIPVVKVDCSRLEEDTKPLWNRSTSANLVYVIYTSGTTGKPKGVCIQTEGVVNTIENVTRFYNVYAGQSILQYTKYSFDASIAYSYAAFSNGCCILLSPPEKKNLKERIGLLHMTPILLQDYGNEEIKRLQPHVETWSVGGDLLSDAIMNRVIGNGIPLIQVYGPTEATILQCMAKMKQGSHVGRLIGRPISNFLWGLQQDDHKIEVSRVDPTEGELLMAGTNLARGYMNSPELTDSCFLHERTIYKSGDVVRRLPSGHFIYIHRQDRQMKIRGYRVDLSEIENVLSEIENIGSCTTDYVEQDGNAHVIVYYTGKSSVEEIRSRVATELPHYMHPSYIVRLANIPMNSNSKVDRSKLPNPFDVMSSTKVTQQEAKYAHRTTNKVSVDTEIRMSTEDIVTEIWKATLNKESIHPGSNFYAEGGHSIKAALICQQIEDQLQITCPVELIFKYPVLQDFVKSLQSGPLLKDTLTKTLNDTFLSKCRKIPVNPFQKYMLDLYSNPANDNRLSYNNSFKVKVDPCRDENFLRVRINNIVMHQTALRSIFLKSVENDTQYLAERLSGTECFVSLRTPPATDNIDPFNKPPFSVNFRDSTLHFVISHVIEDGHSFSVLAKQLIQDKEPSATFDYFKSRLTVDSSSLKYWREKMDGFTLNKLEANPFCSKTSPNVAVVERELNGLYEVLEQRASQEKNTPFVLMLHALIHAIRKRIEKQNEPFAIGVPVDLRSSLEEQETVGYFVNTIPLMIPAGEAPISIEKVKSLFEDAFSHRHVPYDMISKEGVFDVMLVADNFQGKLLDTGAGFQVVETKIKTTKFPLTFFVSTGCPLQVRVEYKPSLLHSDYVEDLIADWKDTLLGGCARKPLIDVKRSEFSTDLSFDQLLLRQSRLSLANTAVSDSDHLMDYKTFSQEMQHKAGLLKRALIEATGEIIASDDVIPIISAKSIDTTISCLAIMLAGGAYAPVDRTQPKKRIEGILKSLKTEVYVADKDWEIPGKKWISFIRTREVLNARLNRTTVSTNIAYVISTSGTQGSPKAVVIEHRSIANLTTQAAKTFYTKPTDVIYHFTNFAYDNSVLELAMALSNGAALYYPHGNFTAERFATEVDKYKVTHTLLFPGLVNTFEDHELQILTKLRYWIVGAEKITQKLLDRTLALGTSVIQNYGPTESTTFILWRIMKKLDYAQNLGRPIGNALCFVDAPNLKTGGLFIGGVGLLRGYMALAEQPFTYIHGEKVLPTSDLVKRLPSGDILFVGRNDSQVKIRGQRVDITEVEEALQSHPIIRQAKIRYIEENQRLVSYYTSTSSMPGSPKEFLAYLKKCVPLYMLPSSFIHLKRFPLTSNAKIDIKSLPLEEHQIKKTSEALMENPTTATEFQIWKIWSDEFKSDKIGIEDDFFLLGGNSLIAQSLVVQITKTLGKNCSQELLYRCGNIRKLATSLEADDGQQKCSATQQTEVKLDYDQIPLSYQQEQMLFLHAIDEKGVYNMPFVQFFSLDLDVQKLHSVFHRLIQENEILRTVIVDDTQKVLSMTEVFFQLDLHLVQDHSIKEEVIKLKSKPFDLSESVLRCRLLKTSSAYVVVLIIHHIATDASSTQLIEKKMSKLYSQQSYQPRSGVGAYAIFSVNQKNVDYGSSLEKAALRLKDPIAERLFDQYEDTDRIVETEVLFSAEDIFTVCSAEHVSPYVVFLSLFYRTLSALFGKSTIVVGSPVSGRKSENADTIGYFLNNVVVIAKSSSIQDFKSDVNEAMSFSDVPFNLLVDKLKIRRSHESHPLYDVYLNCRYDLENEESLTMVEASSNSQLRLPSSSTHPMEIDVDEFKEVFRVSVRLKGQHDHLSRIVAGLKQELKHLSTVTKVKTIVSELVKIEADRLAEEDNFFDIGGNSLLLLKLRTKLNQKFGSIISVTDLLENQRIIDIAHLLNEDTTEIALVSVIHQAACEEKILVFLHPLIGGSLAYSNLYPAIQSKLPNVTIVSVDHPSPIKEHSIEDLCKRYILELQPYVAEPEKMTLIGASFGGILCYELARQTQLPLNIISIDSTANTSHQKQLTFEEHEKQMKQELKEYDIGTADQKRVIHDSWKLLQLSYKYHPTEKIPNRFYQLYIDDPTNGWDGVLHVESRQIDGSHLTMLKKENCGNLSEIIADIL